MYNYIEPYITADIVLDTFTSIRIRMATYEIDSVLKEKGCQPNNIRAALFQLEKDGYAKVDGNLNDWYIITGDGAMFIDKGGYKSHFEKLNTDAEYNKQRVLKSDKKLEVDLANAERIYKTYRSTRVMAIIATIVSIILLLLKLAEVFGRLDLSKQ